MGIFTIHAYAICILVGIVVALVLTSRRLTRRGAEPGVAVDIALWAVVFGIIVARLYHVFTHPGDYFGEGKNLWAILFIWEGGNAIFGSLIGGAIGAYIGCRITGVRFWTFADALAPGMLLAQAIGRLGNWFNHELFGQPTNLPWGLEIESSNPAFPVGLADGTLFHPTFLYEILWNVFGAVLLLLIEREWRLQWGKLFALYLIWYGLGRIWFESIRVDPSQIFFGLRVNVEAAILAVLIGIVIFVVQRRRHPGVEPGPYVPGREWGRDDQVESRYTAEDFERPGDDDDQESAEVPATSSASPRSGSTRL
nr:prolipoprotein diacylglyceryl transferase [Naasia aerilata]